MENNKSKGLGDSIEKFTKITGLKSLMDLSMISAGIKAFELGILRLSSDQRYFMWGSNGRKLMNVPFEEHPYSALAAWFKTDEGLDVVKGIEKRLK